MNKKKFILVFFVCTAKNGSEAREKNLRDKT